MKKQIALKLYNFHRAIQGLQDKQQEFDTVLQTYAGNIESMFDREVEDYANKLIDQSREIKRLKKRLINYENKGA